MSRALIGLLALVVLAEVGSAQFSVSTLPRLGEYESRRTSSYDRSGANGDYRSLKAGETLELFSEVGPAEIRHLGDYHGHWRGLPSKESSAPHVLGQRDGAEC
jgi:hypothetical protein